MDHTSWLLVAAINFIIQIAYFYNDKSRLLFLAKKVSTPLLLFSALFIVVYQIRAFPPVPCLILLAMGLGELGIEGSAVVEADKHKGRQRKSGSLAVTIAGLLFLLVNIGIGVLLFVRSGTGFYRFIGPAASAAIFGSLVYLLLRFFRPAKETRFQIKVYSISLMVLFVGVLTDLPGGLSGLGQAAAVLTLSDSLVLFRMGAAFDKKSSSGSRMLFILLVLILLLYYLFIGLLIDLAVPF
jgi:hypothetical protein